MLFELLSLSLSVSLSSGHLVSSLLPWVGLLTVYISLEMKGVTLCLLTTLSFRAHCEPFRCVCLYSIISGRDLLFFICLFSTMSLFSGRPAGPYICICFVGGTRVLDPFGSRSFSQCDSESHTHRHIFFYLDRDLSESWNRHVGALIICDNQSS